MEVMYWGTVDSRVCK